MIDFSQMGEQGTITKYFGDYVGTFLDIGANNGRTFSNTHALALLGWSGVCVEPNEGAYTALNTLYTENDKIQCIKACVGLENKEVDLFVCGDSLLSTLIEGETVKWTRNHNAKFVKVRSQMITFAELSKQTKLQKFDFINIDCEGTDYDVLSQIDLTDVKMVCVEINLRNRFEYIKYCNIKYGMKLLKDDGLKLIFSR